MKIRHIEGSYINWAEVSRLLTAASPAGSDRTRIGKNYSGKKYKRKVERLRQLIDLWVRWQEKTK